MAKVSLLGFELGLELAATWLVLDSVESAVTVQALPLLAFRATCPTEEFLQLLRLVSRVTAEGSLGLALGLHVPPMLLLRPAKGRILER